MWNYIDSPWNWKQLSLHIATPELINKYPNKAWDWDHISRNIDLTWDFIKEHADKLNWSGISINICITPDIVNNNPTFPWDYDAFADNMNMSEYEIGWFVMDFRTNNIEDLNCYTNFITKDCYISTREFTIEEIIENEHL